MSKAKIKTPGLVESGSPLKPDSNIVWSSGKNWNGLIVEQHKFAALPVPDFKKKDHSLTIRFSALPAGKNKGKNPDPIDRFANICFFSMDSAPHFSCGHHQHEVFVLKLLPETLKRVARELRSNLNIELVEHHQLRDAQIEHIGMALKTEAEDGFLSGRLYGESLGTALTVHLLSKYSVIKAQISLHKGGLTPANLRRVIEFIHENLTEDIGLSNLAKVANLSQFRFAHNFKQATGLAPHQYVIHERLERAKKMLRETDLTVTTVAYAVGCGSPSRFTLLFRRAYGVIPSVYRTSFR